MSLRRQDRRQMLELARKILMYKKNFHVGLAKSIL
jgi:hypothetical protein